jgi:hypothetical protein
MLDMGVPVGAGTDATRVASYKPWVSLSWLVTGRSFAGLELTAPAGRLDREAALRLWTQANAWFSREVGTKGVIAVGQLADLAVLSADYFTVPQDRIVHITADMTVLGGRIVHGSGGFAGLAPPLAPAMPDWSPVRQFGGYQHREATPPQPARLGSCCAAACSVHGHDHGRAWTAEVPAGDARSFWGAFGCSCWAA